MRLKILVLGIFAGTVLLTAGPAQAEGSKFCHLKQEREGHKQSIDDKVLKKAHYILSNYEELKLSEKQVEKIKTLKTGAKKDIIAKNAEIEILAIDINTALYSDPVDVGAVEKLLDKKYDAKKAKAKAMVRALAEIKGALTDQQRTSLKNLWKEPKKSE